MRVACLLGLGPGVDGEGCLVFSLLVLLPGCCFFTICQLSSHILDLPGWPRDRLPAPSLCLCYVHTRYVPMLLTMRHVQLATGCHGPRHPASYLV